LIKRLCFLIGALLLVLALAACARQPGTPEAAQTGAGQTDAAQVCPTAAPCPDCPECPAAEAAVSEAPFYDEWASSAHAAADSEAFVHWDEEGEIEPACARCHSTPGYLDYLGADGSEVGVVDQPAPTGTVVSCEACHNDTTASLNAVSFPSGVEISGFEESSRCMVCHQGRASTVQVVDAIARAGLEGSEDEASPDLGFVNIHYHAAAATLLGSDAQGGFEYEGLRYQPRFEHVEEFNTCSECHSPHSLEVRVESCATCHTGVTSAESLRDIRMEGSLADYDGDGNIEEGIYYEVEGLREQLYTAIQRYAAEVTGTPIAYNEASHPYWFVDTNGNGVADEDESVRDNSYTAFTPRLLKAAFNFQASLKDHGAYAHNAKYVIQLLYDSTASLNEELSEPVDLSTAHRDDPGHFATVGEAFRHWDEDGFVPSTCARCHTAEGLPQTIATGETGPHSPSASLACSTCHSDLQTFAVYQVEQVTFPSGATIGFEDDPQSNLCLNCHQGRESTASINAAIASAGVGSDTVSPVLRFRNPHYFAAGATLFGSEAAGMAQYDGQSYVGRFRHIGGFDSCQECHSPHGLNVQDQMCEMCHGTSDIRTIRQPAGPAAIDYDGDGDAEEGLAMEIETMYEALYAAIRAYAADTIGTPIVYDGARYPYWMTEDGSAYPSWTPTLLRAAYNYQFVSKDPGAFAHNGEYVLQVLYDSLLDVGGPQAVEGMTRP